MGLAGTTGPAMLGPEGGGGTCAGGGYRETQQSTKETSITPWKIMSSKTKRLFFIHNSLIWH